jgi:beta-lactamase class A
MLISITRRAVVAASVMAVPALLAPRLCAQERRRSVEARLADLEARSRGRLGVAVLDVATGRLIGNRTDERFAMCSTFKALAAAFVLARVDKSEEQKAKSNWIAASPFPNGTWCRPSQRPNRMSDLEA